MPVAQTTHERPTSTFAQPNVPQHIMNFRLGELGRRSQQIPMAGDCCPLAFAAGFEFSAEEALHVNEDVTVVVQEARRKAVELLSSDGDSKLDGVSWSTIRGTEGLETDAYLANQQVADWKTNGHFSHDHYSLSTAFQFGIAVGFGRPVVSFDVRGGMCRTVHIYGARDGNGQLKRTKGRTPKDLAEQITCQPTIPFHFSVTFEEALQTIRTTTCSVVEYSGSHFTAWCIAPPSPPPALYIQPDAWNICPAHPNWQSLSTSTNGQCFFESIERVRAFKNETFLRHQQLRVMACAWLVVPIGPQDHNAPQNTERRSRADLASNLKYALWKTADMREALEAMTLVAPDISEEADTSSILNTYALVACKPSFYAEQILMTATAWAIGATVGVYRNKSTFGQPIGPIRDNLPVHNVRHINRNHFEGFVHGCEESADSFIPPSSDMDGEDIRDIGGGGDSDGGGELADDGGGGDGDGGGGDRDGGGGGDGNGGACEGEGSPYPDGMDGDEVPGRGASAPTRQPHSQVRKKGPAFVKHAPHALNPALHPPQAWKDQGAVAARLALGPHWTIRGHWTLLGFTGKDTTQGKNGSTFGHRIRCLMEKHPWIENTPPRDSWAPGWVPMDRTSISDDDTMEGCRADRNDGLPATLGSMMCRSLYDKVQNMLRSDALRLHEGSVLSEKHSPKERLASFPELIAIYNCSAGYCDCCGNVFSGVRASQECDVDGNRSEEYTEQLMAVWTPQRIENWLIHVVSNIEKKAICKYCNTMTKGKEQLMSPYFERDGSSSSAVVTAQSLPARYEQARLEVAKRGDTGGPRATLPAGFRLPPRAAERDATTAFECRFPGCGKVHFSRRTAQQHARVHDRQQPGYYDSTSADRCWTERPLRTGEGFPCHCGQIFSAQIQLSAHQTRAHGSKDTKDSSAPHKRTRTPRGNSSTTSLPAADTGAPPAKPPAKRAAAAAAAKGFYQEESSEEEENGSTGGVGDDRSLSTKARASKFGSSDEWKFYDSNSPQLPPPALPFAPHNAIDRTFILPRDYPPYAHYLAKEKQGFLGWMGTAA